MFRHLTENLRVISRRPGPTVASVIALAFAIGLFAAVVSVMQAFLFRSSMIRDIDQVVRVRERIGDHAGLAVLNVSPQMFDAWRAKQTVFAGMAAATTRNVVLQGNATSDSLRAGIVTANFFRVLGITPTFGRDFVAGEDRSGHDDVVLLSDGTWRNRFAADPHIVGRRLRIDGRLHTVIGVMPPHLSHPYGAQVWLPFRWDLLVQRDHSHFLYVPARLRPGIGVRVAQSTFSALTAAIHRAQPELGQTDAASLSPLRDESLGDLRPTLWLLFAAAVFVVFVAALNTATLFFAQSLANAHATNVRIALGATRGTLFRRALVRSVFVVGTATSAALLVAPWLYAHLSGLSGSASIREFDSVARLDLPTAAWIAGAAGLVAIVLAWLDTQHAFASTSTPGLNARGTTITRGTRRQLSTAIVVQCMLAFVLATAGLLVTLGYHHLRVMDRGFASNNLLVGDLTFPAARYPTPASRNAIMRQLLIALRALPDVRAAGASTVTPDWQGDWAASFDVPDRAPLPDPGYELTNHRLVTPGYFETMGMPMLAGRDFDHGDPTRDAGAVVVSRSFARHIWPNQQAIGRHLDRLNLQKEVVARLTVIGVVGDVVEAVRGPVAPAARSWYMSTAAGTNSDYSAISVVVRPIAADSGAAAGMRQVLARIDPALAWSDLVPMRTRLAASEDREKLSSFLFTLFAVCSVLIALGGLYGALAFLVESSRREFGVRLALGALSRQVLANVLLRALRLAGFGVLLGALLALPLISVVGAFVYGTSLHDAWALAPLAAGVLILALLAGLLPALRAAHVAPQEALRHE
ncbi:MAG: ABC transporter permease [Rhodanobacteraceae bacterium]